MTVFELLAIVDDLQLSDRGAAYEANVITDLRSVDVPELRSALEYHAKHLREVARLGTEVLFPIGLDSDIDFDCLSAAKWLDGKD